MSTETVEAPAAAPENQAPAPQPTESTAEAPKTDETSETKPETPAEGEKKQKEWWEKELQKKQRRIDSLTRRLYSQPAPHLQERQNDGTNAPDDSETLSLTRAELERLAEHRALQLAPTLAEQRAAVERRQGVYDAIEAELGVEKFAELSRDLEAALDGLTDGKRPKPLVDAVFDSEMPRQLIEYLADPDNAAEVTSLQRMSPLQLGRAMTKLESKLAAKKAEEKPQPSKATAPIEPIRAAGGVRDDTPSDSDSIEDWVKKERKRLAAKFKR